MATPVEKINPSGQVTLEALIEALQYVPDGDEDEIGIRRVAFMTTFLSKAPDDLLLWVQNFESRTPQGTTRLAAMLRDKPDVDGAIVTLNSEFENNKKKLGPRLMEVLDYINSESDLKTELFSVMPFVVPQDLDKTLDEAQEDDLEVSPTKVDGLMSYAGAIPTRVDMNRNGDVKTCWKIVHSDGIMVYVPVDHPDVSHLEELFRKGEALTFANVFKGVTSPRKRVTFETARPEQDPPSPPTTRTGQLQMSMEKARDDKIRSIRPKIVKRERLLKSLNPGMTEASIKYRALGWAKYELEYRNRFVPKEHRQQVTQSVWDTLFGEAHYNLNTTQLRNVDVYYDRYSHHVTGYDLASDRDGRVTR